MKLFVYLLLAIGLLSAGCVMRSEFTPYVGKQATWPTAPGAFAKTFNGVPIYTSYPERPYEVLGSGYLVGAQLADMNAAAARMAKKYNGDAAMIMGQQTKLATVYTGADGFVTPINHQHTEVVIIKWK